MIKKIAFAVILTSWLAIPSANAITAATGSGSGGSWSGTLYDTGSGTWSGSGTYTPPGDLYTGTGSGTSTGSGGGCWPYCTVPEPETYMLMGVGLLGLYFARRRK